MTLAVLLAGVSAAETLPGEDRRLREAGVTVTQEQIVSGEISFEELQAQGRLVFSTPFNALDGYGDGPVDSNDPLQLGGRPSLQGNGFFLRLHGLDGQSCLECHSVVSNRSVPPVFGIGGAGGSASNAMVLPTSIDITSGKFNGRFINPPSVFGAGGIQLVANEMTEDLQALMEQARVHPGVDVRLRTKGVDFGSLRYVEDVEGGYYDFSGVEGIDDDLVVRPFGRKGEFSTVRAFDLGALAFHFGMQAVELVGDVDADGDGVHNEIGVGEVSALEVFITTLPRPRQRGRSDDDDDDDENDDDENDDDDEGGGRQHFVDMGCADCHLPQLETRSSILGYRLPEVASDPSANVFYEVDLSVAGFARSGDGSGGITVPMFADLKRHHMGDALAENFAAAPDLDPFFTTARLWGVADTAPYMHDGRATTLSQAILMHGGAAQDARDAYAASGFQERASLLRFLRSLRNPQPSSSRANHRQRQQQRGRRAHD